MSRILCVDDEASILAVFSSLLKAQGHDVSTAGDGPTALDTLSNSPEFNVMISDMRMSPMNGMELLQKAHEMKPNLAIIMLTAYSSVETAIESLKFGAFDYCTKPFKVDEFLSILNRALEYNKTLEGSEGGGVKDEKVPEIKFFLEQIVAESKEMREVCQNIKKVAPTDTTVLIFGEKGAGKLLIAKTIHDCSRRAEAAFVDVNCADMPEPVLESALFGHEAGIIAGESGEKAGYFEEAGEGTVLLEEIEEMPPSVQDKLMKFLQTRTFTRMGGKKEIPSNVRIICSSHRDPHTLMSAGAFRADLFSRIGAINIEIKPLRQRKDDILPMAWVLAKSLSVEGETPLFIDAEVRTIFEAHDWPGNVNELKDVLKESAEKAQDGRIVKASLPEYLAGITVEVSSGSPVDIEKSRGLNLRSYLSAKAGLPGLNFRK